MSTSLAQTMTVRRLTGALGAEVSGLDLRTVGADEAAQLRAVLVEHQVVVVRDQDFTPAEMRAFFTQFGEPMDGIIKTRSKLDVADVNVLATNDPGDAGKWHTDHTFIPEPPSFACLYAIQLPTVGGDTCFASMGAAYEALSQPMRTLLEGLTAVHSNEKGLRRLRTEDRGVDASTIPELEAAHPLVRTHPESGRKSLFFAGHYVTRIPELSEPEAAALIRFLDEWVKEPRFQLRHSWAPKTVVMWDERSTLHCGVADYTERRVFHRLMLTGDAPV